MFRHEPPTSNKVDDMVFATLVGLSPLAFPHSKQIAYLM